MLQLIHGLNFVFILASHIYESIGIISKHAIFKILAVNDHIS